jgi:hypothetical protein
MTLEFTCKLFNILGTTPLHKREKTAQYLKCYMRGVFCGLEVTPPQRFVSWIAIALSKSDLISLPEKLRDFQFLCRFAPCTKKGFGVGEWEGDRKLFNTASPQLHFEDLLAKTICE